MGTTTRHVCTLVRAIASGLVHGEIWIYVSCPCSKTAYKILHCAAARRRTADGVDGDLRVVAQTAHDVGVYVVVSFLEASFRIRHELCYWDIWSRDEMSLLTLGAECSLRNPGR